MTLTTYDLDGRALGCTTDGETKYRDSCMKLVIATVTILKRRGVLPGDRVDKKKYGVVIGLGGPTREQIKQYLARKRLRVFRNSRLGQPPAQLTNSQPPTQPPAQLTNSQPPAQPPAQLTNSQPPAE